MTLHPQAQAFIDSLAEQNPPAWEELGPVAAREAFLGLGDIFGEGPAIPIVKDLVFDNDVPVRLYKPNEDDDLPVVMLFHGGGWVLGNLATHDAMCHKIAVHSGAAVISVDYGLAPENSYPGPLNQCYRATCYAGDHAAELGLDGNRLLVAGDSAGGNLAAAVAIQALDRKGPVIGGQVLMYPVVSPDFDTPSYLEFAEGHGLTRKSMQWFWECYMAGGDSLKQPYADLSGHDLTGLPPALVITAQYDVLRDEGKAFADRLESAGCDVTHSQYLGMLHGFIHFAALFDDSQVAIDEVCAFIQTRTH